jgi:hypothetical protein
MEQSSSGKLIHYNNFYDSKYPLSTQIYCLTVLFSQIHVSVSSDHLQAVHKRFFIELCDLLYVVSSVVKIYNKMLSIMSMIKR